jgi:peptide/nickel transport system substrate-binding protein
MRDAKEGEPMTLRQHQGLGRRPFTRRLFLQLSGAAAAASGSLVVPAGAVKAARLRNAPAGDLRVGAPEDSYRSDERADIGMYPLNTNIFESLVRLTPDYQIEPLLAESWTFVEPNTWRFKLRQGVTFHDGTPFKADAVKWTMDRIAGNGGGVLAVDKNSTVIVDDFTVEITPSRPNRRLVQQLNHPNNSILAPNSDPAAKRIGTGPFREVAYVRADHYAVEANGDYWGEPPRVQTITFHFYPDPITRVLALQSGDVDLIYDVPRESTQEITGNLSLATSKVGAYEALYVNIHGKAPYDLGQDPSLREALAYAVDKAAIVSGVWQGNADVNQTMIPPAILGKAAADIVGTTYDPAKAKQLLDAAGWAPGAAGIRAKNGRQLHLAMIVGFPSASVHIPMPEFVQAQMREVGVELEIVQTPDTATYQNRLTAGTGDLWAEIGSQNDGNPCFLPDLLFSSPESGGDPESTAYGRAFAPGKAFDAHIDDCRSAVTTEAVQAAAAAAMKILIDEEHVVIPIAGIYRIFGLNQKVHGFEAHPSDVNQTWAGVSVAASS